MILHTVLYVEITLVTSFAFNANNAPVISLLLPIVGKLLPIVPDWSDEKFIKVLSLAIFLLSEKSSWITGQIIGVDGGRSNIV